MKRRRLFLAPEHRRRLEAAARQAAPEECCGVLLGRMPEADVRIVTGVIETANAAKGDRAGSYEIAAVELVSAWRRARAAGESIVGFYHSPPKGCGAASFHDARRAWPDMSYLIVALEEDACGLASWRFERDAPDRMGTSIEREELCVAGAEESVA